MIKRKNKWKLTTLCCILCCMFCNLSVPVLAKTDSDTLTQSDVAEEIGVYAKTERNIVNEYTAGVKGKKAELTADGNITFKVSKAPSKAVTLVVYYIPETETEAWSWFSECLEKGRLPVKPVHIMDVYFLDESGNRISAEGAELAISCKHCGTIQKICTVDTDGNVGELWNDLETKKQATFTANDSRYYIIAEKMVSDAGNNDHNNGGKPYIEGKSEINGWDNIKEQLDSAKEKDTITVGMNGTTVVPGGIFNIIKGKDVSVVFDMGDGIFWTVNGKDITEDKVGDIDFGVTVGKEAGKTIPVEIINKVTGERFSMNLTLAYDGEFGFQATLTLNINKKNVGMYANLFYYNPKSRELEYVCASQIDEDGNAKLMFTHASDYTIVIDEKDMGEVDTNRDTQDEDDTKEILVPETKDGKERIINRWCMILLILTVVIAGTEMLVAKKKRK